MKRLFKIWGMILTIMLVVGVLIPAAPAMALYGSQQWQSQPIPSTSSNVLLAGSDVVDIAVGPGVIYALNGGVAVAPAPYAVALSGKEIYKSTDGGNSFLPTTPSPLAGATKFIAVAPDNANVIAITDGTTVTTSTDGGSTWQALPAIMSAGPTWAGTTITGLTAAPARSGAIFGREYAVSLALIAAGTGTVATAVPLVAGLGGDVLIIGGTASWTSVGGHAVAPAGSNYSDITGTMDFMAVQFTPNFLGDRCVSAVGFGPVASATNVKFQIYNTATPSTTIDGAALPAVSAIDFGGAVGAVVAASIALPSDFDATTSSGRRAYVGFTAGTVVLPTADSDTYRVDDNIARALSATATYSLAYAGTISAGSLFRGAATAADVKFSTDMTSGSPTWTSATKFIQPAPAGTAFNIQVAVASDFATSKKVYVGSSGPESAFSISTNGGISYNQRALIDIENWLPVGVPAVNTRFSSVGAITGNLGITPDGKNIFLVTKGQGLFIAGGTFFDGAMSVWVSPTPPADNTWKRVLCKPPAGLVATPVATSDTGSISLSPDYATTSTVYLFDYTTSNAGFNFWRSSDGGETWNQRIPPGSGTTMDTYGVQDANVVYWADASANLYKSTNGGFTWNSAVSMGTSSPTIAVNIPKADSLIIGATGSLATSNDGGTTFTKIDLNTGERYRVARDAGFTTNNILYLGDATNVTGKVYKFVLGTDTKPLDMLAPDAGFSNITNLYMRNGALYVSYAGWATNPGAPTGAVTLWPTITNGTTLPGLRWDRTVDPLDTPGTGIPTWSALDTGALPIATSGGSSYTGTTSNDGGTIIWVRYGGNGSPGTATAPVLYAYQDQVGATKPVITAPKTGTNLSINPNNGLANQFTLVLNPMGSGNGLVTYFQIEITDNTTGWPGAVRSPATQVNNPTQPSIIISNTAFGGIYQLQSNTAYLVRVRAANEVSNDWIDSAWSDPINVNVQSGGIVNQTSFGPQLLGPTGGATNVSLVPGFAWAPINGATTYQFKLATDAALTKTVAGTPASVTLPSFQVTTPLTEGTTYFLSVQAIAPTQGPVSIGTFTTAPKAVAATTQPTFTMPPISIPAPIITIPPAPAPIITIPPAPAPVTPPTPAYVWAIIIIGAILVIAVIVLILRTRKNV